MCRGSHFAMIVAQLALAAILGRYRLRLQPGVTVEPEAALSLRPRGAVPILLEPI
jgi:cytochrome P450